MHVQQTYKRPRRNGHSISMQGAGDATDLDKRDEPEADIRFQISEPELAFPLA